MEDVPESVKRNQPKHPLSGPDDPLGFVVQLTEQEIEDVLHAIAFYRPSRNEDHEVFVRRYKAFTTFQAQIQNQLRRVR